MSVFAIASEAIAEIQDIEHIKSPVVVHVRIVGRVGAFAHSRVSTRSIEGAIYRSLLREEKRVVVLYCWWSLILVARVLPL